MSHFPKSGSVRDTIQALQAEFPNVTFPPRASIKDSIDAIKALMPEAEFAARADLRETLATMTGVIDVPLAIDGTPVLTADENAPYTGFTASATGGVLPYTFSLVGTWPTGIDIDGETGAVTGTPTENGSFPDLSVRVTDNRGETADLDTFTLVVDPE